MAMDCKKDVQRYSLSVLSLSFMTLFEFLNLSRIVTSVTKSPLQWWFTLLVIVIVNAEKVIKPVDDIFLSTNVNFQ